MTNSQKGRVLLYLGNINQIRDWEQPNQPCITSFIRSRRLDWNDYIRMVIGLEWNRLEKFQS